MEEFKQRQRATWAAGDYPSLAVHIADVGERLVARVGVEPGMRVLDVACGDGNAARPAARARAEVTGLDLVPELLEAGRAKAAAEGLELEWVEGDAEELPFPDASFDYVLSTFGHMFAPRHRRVADELVRVCRAGGVIGLCTWTPDGAVGELFRASADYMPPPPDFAEPPILWGSEAYVREIFAEAATGFEFEQHSATIEAESMEEWADEFFAQFPPMVVARNMLGERFSELRDSIVAIWEARNEAVDGGVRVPQEYLLSVVRL